MIAKVFIFLAAVAIAHSTLIGSGIVAPGLLNAGILAPGLAVKGAPLLGAVNTASVVAIPGAVSTDRRIIGTPGVVAGVPLANGLIANGLLGAAPLAWNNGIVPPLGIKGAGLLGVPGITKTIL